VIINYIIVFASVAIALVTTSGGVLSIRERVGPISAEQYKFRELFSILV